MTGETPREELRMQLAQAQTRAESEAAREHVARALELVDLLPRPHWMRATAAGRLARGRGWPTRHGTTACEHRSRGPIHCIDFIFALTQKTRRPATINQ